MLSTYQNIWFCGLAASGKTTVLRLIHEKLKDVEFLNDSEEVVEFIKKDLEEKHHTKPTPDSFILKDSEAVYHSVKRLIEKAQVSPSKKVIEISRGHDESGIIDFSYQYLLSSLPENLKKNSLFVYIYAPYEQRKKWNSERPGLSKEVTPFASFFCPEEAFERFFVRDDFWEAVKANPVDVFFIPNIYSLENLKRKTKTIFIKK